MMDWILSAVTYVVFAAVLLPVSIFIYLLVPYENDGKIFTMALLAAMIFAFFIGEYGWR